MRGDEDTQADAARDYQNNQNTPTPAPTINPDEEAQPR